MPGTPIPQAQDGYEPLRSKPLRILFVCRDLGRVRNFEGPLELLARRGHAIHVAVEKSRERIPGQREFIDNLAARHAQVSWGPAPRREAGDWTRLSLELRRALDHLHFERPEFDNAPIFRDRARRDAPALVQALARQPAFQIRAGRSSLITALETLERSVPPSEQQLQFVRQQQPDLLLITPLVWFGAHQTDWVRCGKICGVRTIGCLFSWDNLTSKGSIRERPHMLTVWNEQQRREAVELHGLPPTTVVATGATGWDAWFERQPSRTREQFCLDVGLNPRRPYIVYAESSGYTKGEGPFVRRWAADLRRLGGQPLRRLQVLVRPHPQTDSREWVETGVTELEDVVVWPTEGQMPLDEPGRRNFFDTLYYAKAIVGINTTSFIDSAIIGRPCLAYAPPEYETSQDETLHFQYLLEANGGHLQVARTIDDHVAQLLAALADDSSARERASRFIETFVRPAGVGRAAAPSFVAAIEDAGNAPRPDPLRRGSVEKALATAMHPLAAGLASGRLRLGPMRRLLAFREEAE